ncbi:MAG: alpha/beta hydrolase [Gammaproteobacteria bacterium]|nr:alpha/beta hydrolase [Gammaproteobacteria bacterium]MDP2346181.1 alpha/beta hydrolase [Gammaproteobacteria bacterium]
MSRLSIASVVSGSLAMGFAIAGGLIFGPLAGASEPVITGTALLACAAGWGLLAGLSTRWTNQPQRWALVPAIYMGLAGAALLLFVPSGNTLNALGWVWPVTLLALVLWMTLQIRRHLHNWTRAWLVYPVVIVYAASALGGVYQTIRETMERRLWERTGSLVDVDGHHLYLSCRGSGGPTVILESGLGETSAYWDAIATAVSADTKVCVYDRAGRGGSDPAPVPLDGRGVARELHALIERTTLSGPFVLVGHSSGALYVRLFAELYPEEVAGVVLLDGQPAEAFTRLPNFPAFYYSFRRLSAVFPSLARVGAARMIYHAGFAGLPTHVRDMQRASHSSVRSSRSLREEFAALPTTLEQARSASGFGDRPLIVVTAGRDAQPGWMVLQDELPGLSTNSQHRVLPHATHMSIVDGEDSGHSIQAIRDVIRNVN